jgi:hypothetical protein
MVRALILTAHCGNYVQYLRLTDTSQQQQQQQQHLSCTDAADMINPCNDAHTFQEMTGPHCIHSSKAVSTPLQVLTAVSLKVQFFWSITALIGWGRFETIIVPPSSISILKLHDSGDEG